MTNVTYKVVGGQLVSKTVDANTTVASFLALCGLSSNYTVKINGGAADLSSVLASEDFIILSEKVKGGKA